MTGETRKPERHGPEWSSVLRGLVYEAHAAKGTDEYEAKVEAIVDAWYLWPLAEAEIYLHHARERVLRVSNEIEAAELGWYDDVFEQIDERRLERLTRRYVELARVA